MALSLKKGQPEVLTTVSKLNVGAAWKTSGDGTKGLLGKLKKLRGIDIDLTAVALEEGSPKRMAWFDDTDPFDNGSLVTLGDNKTGRAVGDDETIAANLDNIPSNIDEIVYIVSAYKEGVSFANVSGVSVNVYNDGTLLGTFMPDLDSRQNAIVAAKVKRTEYGWTLEVINQMGYARSRDQLLQLAKQYA